MKITILENIFIMCKREFEVEAWLDDGPHCDCPLIGPNTDHTFPMIQSRSCKYFNELTFLSSREDAKMSSDRSVTRLSGGQSQRRRNI